MVALIALILAVVFAGIEAFRSRSFGWAAVALIAFALACPGLTGVLK